MSHWIFVLTASDVFGLAVVGLLAIGIGGLFLFAVVCTLLRKLRIIK